MKFINVHTHHLQTDGSIQVVNYFLHTYEKQSMASVGLHPWHVDDHFAQIIEKLKVFCHHPNVVAIGEAGLDQIKGSELSLQKKAFEAQIDIAKNFGKPLIIHCVKSFNEILELHKKHAPNNPWVIHGFKGNLQTAKQCLSKGIYLSFGAALVNNHPKTIDAFRQVPDDMFFLETDDQPDLLIQSVYEKAAEIKNMNVERLKELVYCNFINVFKINV